MGGGQQLPGRLPPQDEPAPVGGGDRIGRIRLAAPELLDLREPEAEEFFEGSGIDPMPLLDRLRPDELLEHRASLP